MAQKLTTRREFTQTAAKHGYDPAEELIVRRNDLAEKAEALIQQSESETDPERAVELAASAFKLLDRVEDIDTKLMPYMYARQSHHTVGDEQGNDLLSAFANAIKGNLSASGA